MAWIKRNLFFVIGVAVGLLLTGYCGYLLYTSLNANAGVTDEYNSTRDNLRTMQQKSPYPSKENIEAAKADQERVRAFLADFRKSFSSFPPPPVVDEKGFKTYLEESLVRYRAEATNAEVQLPQDFNFTFSGLIGKLTYPPGNIEPWMEQMEEISAILDIVYKARVNALVGLCRVPVSVDDVGTGDCILPTTSVTNETGVTTPYKITFRGFSTELAAVLEGFARSSNCFIVKTVDVVADKSAMPTPGQPVAQQQPVMTYNSFVPPPQMMTDARSRGMRERGMPRPMPRPIYVPQSPGATPAAPTGPVTVLSETPLLVNMGIDVVKLKASER